MEVLAEISKPDVNLAVWQRPADPVLAREVQALAVNSLPDQRRRTTLQLFQRDLHSLFSDQGLDSGEFSGLRADMHVLAERMAGILGSQELVYRLVTVADNECSRFHLDSTPFRLICTYQGPGTQWLADTQVDWTALGRGAGNDGIIRFGTPSQLQPFWVGILKGGSVRARQGLVHRSPTIVGSGQIRVLFCLDCDGLATIRS